MNRKLALVKNYYSLIIVHYSLKNVIQNPNNLPIYLRVELQD